MGLLVDSVKDPIDRLFKLSIWVRNPATRLPSSKAANLEQIDEETNVNLLDVFEGYDHAHISSLFLQYKKHVALQENGVLLPAEDKEDTRNKNEEDECSDQVWEPVRTVLLQHRDSVDNGTESFLVRRIAQANVHRRRQFAYWRRHREKLSQHTAAAMTSSPTGDRIQGTAQLGKRTEVNDVAVNAERPAQSITTATRLNLPPAAMERAMSTVSVSEYLPSAWQPSKDSADFPPPPKIPSTEKFFECPYCFTLCSTALLAENAWKAHLIHDLRPYVCTYEQCRNPDQLYDRREDWINHENTAHRMVFRCPEHSDQTFATLPEYQEHVRQQHGGDVLSDENIFVGRAYESAATEADRCCPVCSLAVETAQKSQSHIALHLERFALFSLPRSVGDREDSAHSALANFDSGATQVEDLDVDLVFTDSADDDLGTGVEEDWSMSLDEDFNWEIWQESVRELAGLSQTNAMAAQLAAQQKRMLAQKEMSEATQAQLDADNYEAFYDPYTVFKLREDLVALEERPPGTMFGRRTSFFRRRQTSVRGRWKANEDLLAQSLNDRHLVFIVDNGSTMATHWQETTELVTTLAWRAIGYGDAGIELYFTNQNQPHVPAVSLTNQRTDSFQAAMDRARPDVNNRSFRTDIVPILEKVLGTHTSQEHSSPRCKAKTIIIFTDGIWQGMVDEYAVDNLITGITSQLSSTPPDSAAHRGSSSTVESRPITIQFVRLGQDPRGSDRLRRLDDSDVANRAGHTDIVDCEPSNGDVYKMLLGSLLKDMDEPVNVTK